MSGKTTFWARRRAAVQAEADAELRAAQQAEEQIRAEALADKDDVDLLQEMGLPDPADMQKGDDFSAFMVQDVPEHLRRQALRTLWRSNPVLACVDGLNEYDDDYRAAMLLSEPIKTAYQVGKGMTKHLDEMTRQAEATSAQGAPLAQADAAPEPAEVEVAAATEAEPDDVTETLAEPSSDTEVVAPSPRRMRFQFEETRA